MRFLGQREDRIILLGVAASIHAGAHEGHAVTQIERVVLQQGVRVLGRADRAAEVVIADVAAEGVVDGLLQTEHHAAALVHAAVVVLVHRAVAGVCRVVLDQPERLAGAYPCRGGAPRVGGGARDGQGVWRYRLQGIGLAAPAQ